MAKLYHFGSYLSRESFTPVFFRVFLKICTPGARNRPIFPGSCVRMRTGTRERLAGKEEWSMKIFRKLLLALLVLAALRVPCFAQEAFHGAYLQGFPDGSIRPEKQVTRAELAEILYRMISPDARQELTAESAFRDVGRNHWAYEAVRTMAGLRLMLGDTDGNFRPNDGVTGEELSIILERVRAQDSGKEALAALSSGWAAQEVTFEAGNGWVMGLHGAAFSKEQALSRAELAEILNRILGRTPQSLSDLLVGMPLFSDNLDTEAPYFLAMQEAAIDHTARACGDGERWTGLG